MNQYNISLKQNKLNSGNNIQIVDNIISVVGISGVESNFYYVNQLRNDVESSFVEINDLITNITIDTNLSNSVYDLSSSIEALYLDVSNLNMTKQPTINEGDLLIRDTSGLELALDGKQDTISFLSDICLNALHVHGNIIIDGSFNVNNLINTTINNEILLSTQLDISNEGTGPALKVSQLGNGEDKHVAIFNAGEQGDALLIDSSGNTSILHDLSVNGEIYCNEIKVNSIPINSFTNYCYGNNFNIGNWGRGNRVKFVNSPTLPTNPTLPTKSHSTQFTAINNQKFVCSQLGTYEIRANVIFRNTGTDRTNPCIGIAINDDTNNPTTSNVSPKWDLKPYSQTPFSVNYVSLTEGKVCNLTTKRIYNFNNSTDYVSINTYIERGGGDEFGDSTSNYINLSASIEFKYIGNFDNIT